MVADKETLQKTRDALVSELDSESQAGVNETKVAGGSCCLVE